MKHCDMNIDAVLFDFGGVISEEGFKQGLTEIAKANGLDERTFIQAASDTIYSTGYILGKAPESIFWNALRQKTGIRGDDASLGHEIFSRFILRDWMLDLVRKLKANRVKVGMLSDQTDMLDKLNEKYDFFRLFDYVFNSYHMGKGKREPSLFDDIVKELKTKPDRVLFIDDDIGNIDRARQKGWKGIQYVDRDSFQKDFEEILPLKS
jgi:FMN phosphatase YigB (HAD superfamily)